MALLIYLHVVAWAAPIYGPPPVLCVRVIDGDTIVVRDRGRLVRVRLAKIDTPERGEPGFEAARARVVRLCEGRPVRLVRHGLGRYRRLIADVHLPDGRNLARLLLAERPARPWPRPGPSP